VIEELIPLHRSAENLYLAIQSARESQPEDFWLIDCRDQAYVISRSSDLLLNDCKAAMEYAIAKRTEEQALYSFELAASANRMNSLIAIFLPLATLSSIFGMNLEHGFEHKYQPFGFIGVIICGLAFGLALKYLLLNRPVEVPKIDAFDAPILNRKPNPSEDR
jgi:hypothetical protein